MILGRDALCFEVSEEVSEKLVDVSGEPTAGQLLELLPVVLIFRSGLSVVDVSEVDIAFVVDFLLFDAFDQLHLFFLTELRLIVDGVVDLVVPASTCGTICSDSRPLT